MSRGADRVAHIVQTIEEGHEVQSGSGKILCRADLEDHVVGDAMRSGVLARRLDRTRVKVVADKLRVWKSRATAQNMPPPCPPHPTPLPVGMPPRPWAGCRASRPSGRSRPACKPGCL